MSRLLRRHRKFLASAVLGMWAFALFVGFANACSWDGVSAVSHHDTMAVTAAGDTMDHDMAPGCEEFCSNDIPLIVVLQLVQDQPAGQPLVVATQDQFGFLPISAPILRLASTAHRSPGVLYSLQTVRLTL
jgi:hypothetical protein